MVGALAANFHEGDRSEILADFLFTSWGAVTPVRRQDDIGVDLYCTLTDRVGPLAMVAEYFTVQVKSNASPWTFKTPETVRWLVEHPTPLFLCVVDRRALSVQVHQLFPRFALWALGTPRELELTPGPGPKGEAVQWGNGTKFSLSAPIIEVKLTEMIDEERMKRIREIFSVWVQFDRENCDSMRQGLLRFRMPTPYVTNEMPNGIGEMGNAQPTTDQLKRALHRLAEALECVGGQLGQGGDRMFALEAALLLDRIQKKYRDALKGDILLEQRIPGQLGRVLNDGLNRAVGDASYLYAGFDRIVRLISDVDPLKRFVDDDGKQ